MTNEQRTIKGEAASARYLLGLGLPRKSKFREMVLQHAHQVMMSGMPSKRRLRQIAAMDKAKKQG